MQTIESRKRETDYFINKVKGALMYRGGDFANKDFHKMNAYDFIESCFLNGVFLDCRVLEEKRFPWL